MKERVVCSWKESNLKKKNSLSQRYERCHERTSAYISNAAKVDGTGKKQFLDIAGIQCGAKDRARAATVEVARDTH